MAGAAVKALMNIGAVQLGWTDAQFLLMVYLAWKAGKNTGELCFSMEELIAKLNKSKSAVKRGLKFFTEEEKYLTIIRKGDGRGHKTLAKIDINRLMNMDVYNSVKGFTMNPFNGENEGERGSQGTPLSAERGSFQTPFNAPLKELINNISFSFTRGDEKNKIVDNSAQKGTENAEAKSQGQGKTKRAKNCQKGEGGGKPEAGDVVLKYTKADILRLMKTNGWRPCIDKARQAECDRDRRALFAIAYEMGLSVEEANSWLGYNALMNWEKVNGGVRVMDLLKMKLKSFAKEDPEGALRERRRVWEARRKGEGKC